MAEKQKTGIPVNEKTLEELRMIGAYVGISFGGMEMQRG